MYGTGQHRPGFHPSQLDDGATKLWRGWFSARDSRSYTLVGSRCSAWRNKKTGVAATEPAANGPTFEPAGLNGGPCFTGAGLSVLLTTEAALVSLWSAAAGLATHTIIILAQLTSLPSAGNLIGVGNSAEAFNHSSGLASNGLADSANCWTLHRTTAANNTQWFGGAPTSAPVALAYRFNGTVPLLRIGGVNVPLATTAASAGPPPGAITAPDRVALFAGARSTLGGKLAGKLAEIIPYAGLLSDAECDVACDGVRAWYELPRLT